MSDPPFPDFPDFASKTAGVWDGLARWWDEAIGEGNATQDLLVEPTQERLLELKPGERVLDIACGAGRFTRRMAEQNAQVVAFDQSASFIECARARTGSDLAARIDYKVLNADDTAALVRLGEGQFEAAVCSMALMDMAQITPLLSTLPRLLTPDGRFVFSVTHPAFNSGDAHIVAEQLRRGRAFDTRLSIQTTDYTTARMQPDIGVPGQPIEHYYFHRPLGMLLNACFDHGFVLDRLEEPALPPADDPPGRRTLSWANVNFLPQILIARLRLSRP